MKLVPSTRWWATTLLFVVLIVLWLRSSPTGDSYSWTVLVVVAATWVVVSGVVYVVWSAAARALGSWQPLFVFYLSRTETSVAFTLASLVAIYSAEMFGVDDGGDGDDDDDDVDGVLRSLPLFLMGVFFANGMKQVIVQYYGWVNTSEHYRAELHEAAFTASVVAMIRQVAQRRPAAGRDAMASPTSMLASPTASSTPRMSPLTPGSAPSTAAAPGTPPPLIPQVSASTLGDVFRGWTRQRMRMNESKRERVTSGFIRALDRNGDGVVTHDEFVQGATFAKDSDGDGGGGDADAKAVEDAWALLDRDRSGVIDPDAVQQFFTLVYERQKGLHRTLRSRQGAMAVLSDMLSAAIGVVATLVFFVVVLGFGFFESVVPVLTLVLALGFVFGNLLRRLFESIIVLFVLRPFVIGDWVSIDTDPSTQWMRVQDISFLVITFRNLHGQSLSMPTSRMANAYIVNFSRSGPIKFRMSLSLAWSGAAAAYAALEAALLSRLREPPWDNPELRATGPFDALVAKHSKMELMLVVSLQGIAWIDVDKYVLWRTRLMLVIAQAMDEAGVTWEMPTQPVILRDGSGPAVAAAAAAAANGASAAPDAQLL